MQGIIFFLFSLFCVQVSFVRPRMQISCFRACSFHCDSVNFDGGGSIRILGYWCLSPSFGWHVCWLLAKNDLFGFLNDKFGAAVNTFVDLFFFVSLAKLPVAVVKKEWILIDWIFFLQVDVLAKLRRTFVWHFTAIITFWGTNFQFSCSCLWTRQGGGWTLLWRDFSNWLTCLRLLLFFPVRCKSILAELLFRLPLFFA